MMPAQMMMPAGQGQQHLNYVVDNAVDIAANDSNAAQ
jgi:hypothetical protein